MDKSAYELELEKAASEIRKSRAKKVCLQLPDGLKPKAKEIADFLNEKTGAEIIVWAGSCFGSCDLAMQSENTGADLLIHWGHTQW